VIPETWGSLVPAARALVLMTSAAINSAINPVIFFMAFSSTFCKPHKRSFLLMSGLFHVRSQRQNYNDPQKEKAPSVDPRSACSTGHSLLLLPLHYESTRMKVT